MVIDIWKDLPSSLKDSVFAFLKLFTLDSVYSTSASGAEQTIETNNSNIT